MLERAEFYPRGGVKSCWMVSPALRSVMVLLADAKKEIFQRGIAKDPATGLTADLSRVFS